MPKRKYTPGSRFDNMQDLSEWLGGGNMTFLSAHKSEPVESNTILSMEMGVVQACWGMWRRAQRTRVTKKVAADLLALPAPPGPAPQDAGDAEGADGPQDAKGDSGATEQPLEIVIRQGQSWHEGHCAIFIDQGFKVSDADTMEMIAPWSEDRQDFVYNFEADNCNALESARWGGLDGN